MSTSPVPTLLSSTFTHRTLMLTSVLRPMTASEDTNTRACYQQQFHDALPLRSEGESQNTHDAGPAHTYHADPASPFPPQKNNAGPAHTPTMQTPPPPQPHIHTRYRTSTHLPCGTSHQRGVLLLWRPRATGRTRTHSTLCSSRPSNSSCSLLKHVICLSDLFVYRPQSRKS